VSGLHFLCIKFQFLSYLFSHVLTTFNFVFAIKIEPGYYQSHAVQVVVACRNEEEMEQEAQNLQALMESFYSETDMIFLSQNIATVECLNLL